MQVKKKHEIRLTKVINKRIAKSEDLINWLDRFVDRLSVPSNDRAIIVACFLNVAMEHHKAIVLTISASFHGSAFALVRVEFEAYIRGVWLSYCASDKQVERFKEKVSELSTGQLSVDSIDPTASLFDFGYLDSLSAVTMISSRV